MSLEHFTTQTSNDAKAEYTVAGGHPDQNVTSFLTGGEYLKDAVVTLEPGFFGNPAAAPRCHAENIGFYDFESTCPPGSRVGIAAVHTNFGSVVVQSIYNTYPEKGYPAQFAFRVQGSIALLTVLPLPRTESYGLTIGALNLPRTIVKGLDTTFFGVPTNHGSGSTNAPFLTIPVNCSEANPSWGFYADAWENAGTYLPTGRPDLSDAAWVTDATPVTPVTGCDSPLLAPQFNPGLGTSLVQGGGPVQADSPSGFLVSFHFPQTNDPTDPNTTFGPALPQAPEPKDVTVNLPAGLSLSPTSVDGLETCSDQASGPAGDQVHYDSTKPVTCPDSSKIGTAMALSPLLASHDPITDEVNGAEPIPGSVYLLKPHPGDLGDGQDGKFRLLIQLENAAAGLNFKLPGIATADKQTGQLSATFSDNPQLPAKELTVDFKSGSRAPLAGPTTCGRFQTTSDFVPWSTPGTPDANPTASFDVSVGPGGSVCANWPGARPFSPAVGAGTVRRKAGSSSPFVFKVIRNDGEQELGSIDLTTPPGFSAKLAGVPSCSDAAIATAARKVGEEEQTVPSCPAVSQVGTVTVAAGAGAQPYYVTGKAYLAGPYKGAPLSLVFITPAVAGPLDLGNTVVRAATVLNSETAQITIRTDPLPQILDGVPLRLRSVTTRFDRSDFAINPTNCEPMAVNTTIAGSSGATATSSTAFNVDGCSGLGFKPKLTLKLLGPTRRSAHPALGVGLFARPGDANIRRAALTLPSTELLETSHFRNVCSLLRFDVGSCPPASVYGRAEARIPLLDQPLKGPVYLRANPTSRLPDLVASLDGQIHLDVVAHLDSTPGRIRTTFDTPDIALSSFRVRLFGGKKGLIVNSGGVCGAPRGKVELGAQNGRVLKGRPKLQAACPQSRHRAKRGRR